MLGTLAVLVALADEPDVHTLEAEATYKTALALEAEGKHAEACGLFAKIVDQYGDTAVAASARTQMAQIAPLVPGGACGGPPAPAPKPDKPDNGGDVDVIVSQTILATAWGATVPGAAMRADNAVVYLGGGLLGLGAGLGGTLAFTHRFDVTQGQASTLNLAETLGIYHGVAIVSVWKPGEARPWLLVPGASVVAGGVIGGLIAMEVRPSAGQAALASHGAFWGAYVGSMGLLIAQDLGSYPYLVVLGTADVGLGAGIALAYAFPNTSRARVRLVSLGGGVAATATALTLGLAAASGAELSGPAVGVAELAAAGAGMAVAGVLTRGMDDPVGDDRVQLHPTPPAVYRSPEGRWTVQGGLTGTF